MTQRYQHLFLFYLLPVQAIAAGIIYDNLGPGNSFGSPDGLYQVGYTTATPTLVHRTSAMPFTPVFTSQVGRITVPLIVTTAFPGPLPSEIRIRLMDDVGGLPGSTVFDEFVIFNPPNTGSGATIFTAVAINNATVQAGVRYWLVPRLEVTGSVAHFPYALWPSNSTGDLGVARDDPSFPGPFGYALTFFPGDANGAFRIEELPEPGTAVLLAPALAVAFVAARRRH